MLRVLARTALVFSLVLAGCGDDDDPTGPQTTLLTSGVAVASISGGEDSQRHFRIPVAAGATLLRVTTSGGTGDADL